MAKIHILPIFLSLLYLWIILSPSFCQEEGAGPVDSSNVPAVDSESNMTASNTSESFSNMTAGAETNDANTTSPMNITDTNDSTSSNITSDTGSANSTAGDIIASSSLANTSSDTISDRNTTILKTSSIGSSDDNSTFSGNETFMDNDMTLSDSKPAVDDNNVTVSEGNTTTMDSNMTVSDFNSQGSINTTTAENITMVTNMSTSEDVIMTDNMTNFASDDSFSVNVTTNNETDIIIGGVMNATVSDDTTVTLPPDPESGITTSSIVTSTNIPISPNMEENVGLEQSPFDNTMVGGSDPFDDPFGNPFGDGPEGGDPFGEDIFGPETTQFDLCTEPPCEPPAEPVTTPKPITPPPPPPPPPPPAAASQGFDTLFDDQEKFELKRLPQFSLPSSKSNVPSRSRQDAFERERQTKIARVERLRDLFKSFNAGVPAFGGVNFFNPTKEFSSITRNTGNQIISTQNNNLNQRESINPTPSNNNMFETNRASENFASANINDINTGNSNTRKTSENRIEKPTSPTDIFNSPTLPNPDVGQPAQRAKESGVPSNGVAPPPPPPPQLDKSITRDATFAKFFGQSETSEPGRSIFGSTNSVIKNSQSSNVNSVNTKSANSGNQPFAWPYQVSGSSKTSTQTASARRVVNSVVNEAPAVSSWLDTTPFMSDPAGGRIIDTSIMSSGSSSSNTLDKQLGQAASRIGIPFIGLGDITETLNTKESPTNTRTSSFSSTGRSSASTIKKSAPGVPMNADSLFQNPPMDVNTNPFSARRPGVPVWDKADPALIEFGIPSRSSTSSRGRDMTEIWRNAQLPTAGSTSSRKTGSVSQQNQKPPTRDPPFIFAPKPSSNLGSSIFNIPQQPSTSNVEQPPPPPSKTGASFQSAQFEQPPPPKNLPFSNIDVESSGGIPPPPPPPGRIGYDASEIFAKITGASFGRSGTGESVITTKRSPRFVEDKLSAMHGDPSWENKFFNPPVNKKPFGGVNSLEMKLNHQSSFPATDNNIKSLQNTNIPWSLSGDVPTGLISNQPSTPVASAANIREELPSIFISETTTTSTLPPNADITSENGAGGILPDSSLGEGNPPNDSLNIPTETTTAVPVESISETVSYIVGSSTPSSNLNMEPQEPETTTNSLATSGIDTGSSVSNQTPNIPDPAPVETNAKPVLTSETFPAASQAQLREFPNAAEICRNCNFINGYCRLELPGNCNRFIECSKHDKEVRAFEKECSHGLFWHQGNLTCERPLRVKCEYDPCLQRGVSNHTYIGNCRAYWSCKRSYSSARCCAKGYGYGLHQDGRYGCIPMPDCKDDGQCMSKEERANLTLINANKPKECNLLANPSDLFSYKRGSLILPCAPGTRFDQEQCTCITSQAAPISRVCEKDMYLDFEGTMTEAFKDKSGRGNTVHEKNVWTDNRGIAKFNKDSTITLWKYSNQNIGSSIAITFRFLSYRYPSRMQTLLSNCDQKSGIAAIDITLDTWKSVIDFKIETTQSPGNKISLPYNALQWNNVTLIYDGGSFVAAVDEAYELMFIQGEIPSKHPPLVIGGCSAKTREGLFGLVDDVSIYNGCIPEDLKNLYLFARK